MYIKEMIFLNREAQLGLWEYIRAHESMIDEVRGNTFFSEPIAFEMDDGGRVLPGSAATADVLPEIADAVGDRVKILVDGGIRSGTDIFRALALGADAVMICRPFLISYYGGGTEGIVTYVEKLRAELTDAMYMCGARCLSDITRDMVRELR